MTTFKVRIVINKPNESIAKALMNPDNFPYWQKNLEKFEVIERRPGEVGSIGHLHYSQKGKSYVMVDKLIYCEPGRKFISQVTGDAITAQVETTLNSIGDKTEMAVKWSGKGKTLIIRLLLPLLQRKMKKQSRVELETFKRLIETKGFTFGT